MPDRREHRGPHPRDAELFAPDAWPRLRAAVRDYSWLLTRGYAEPSALKLVGDHYGLEQRQRMAVARSSCSDNALELRTARQVGGSSVAGAAIRIDGFNLLTTIEVALSGGVVLAARDGCFRDIAGVHGTYRKVDETRPAILLAGNVIESLRPKQVAWYLDSPVGNSGRLKALLLEVARERGWAWSAQTVPDPDGPLAESADIVVTADSMILDRCVAWFNLAREVITRELAGARVVPMGGADSL